MMTNSSAYTDSLCPMVQEVRNLVFLRGLQHARRLCRNARWCFTGESIDSSQDPRSLKFYLENGALWRYCLTSSLSPNAVNRPGGEGSPSQGSLRSPREPGGEGSPRQGSLRSPREIQQYATGEWFINTRNLSLQASQVLDQQAGTFHLLGEFVFLLKDNGFLCYTLIWKG